MASSSGTKTGKTNTMPKYKEYFQKMLDQNKEVFDKFRIIHDEYTLNPDKFQEKLNAEGSKIMYIVRKYEDMLCGRSEGTGYGAYSGKLAEKFQEEVRKHFPQIDSIGIIRKKRDTFNIKRIKL